MTEQLDLLVVSKTEPGLLHWSNWMKLCELIMQELGLFAAVLSLHLYVTEYLALR